jgi:hypothetical protein
MKVSFVVVQSTNFKNEYLSIQFFILMQFQYYIRAKNTFFQSESLYIYPLSRSVCSYFKHRDTQATTVLVP